MSVGVPVCPTTATALSQCTMVPADAFITTQSFVFGGLEASDWTLIAGGGVLILLVGVGMNMAARLIQSAIRM